MRSDSWPILLRFALLCLILAAASYVGTSLLRPIARAPQTRLYVLQDGQSLRHVVADLHALKLLDHPTLFELFTRIQGKARDLKVGEYQISNQLKPMQLLTMLTRGHVYYHSVTFIEGWTFKQIQKTLHTADAIKTTLKKQDEYALAKSLHLSPPHLEGWFYPDTYYYVLGTTDQEILTMAYKAMVKCLASEWAARQKNLPYKTSYSALIVASLVEKEASLPEERPIIAGIILKRIKAGIPLQIDPTVIYGLGDKFRGALTRSQLKRSTPYNTYLKRGLPPTPIAMPSQQSIHAALHPKKTRYLYFVATGDGGHVFSKTLAEHNRAVRAYRR